MQGAFLLERMVTLLDDKAVYLFDCLRHVSDTAEGKVLYILALICLMMILDFVTGTVAAWRNPNEKFCSQIGINGILRKLVSIIVLVCCIPVTALIPMELGLASLYVLYLGYLLMETKSILENLEKMCVEISPLSGFFEKLAQSANNEKVDKKK